MDSYTTKSGIKISKSFSHEDTWIVDKGNKFHILRTDKHVIYKLYPPQNEIKK